MLIERIIKHHLRGPGPPGQTCTPITGYFHDKTTVSKENLRVDYYLLPKCCIRHCTLLPPTWTKSLTAKNLRTVTIRCGTFRRRRLSARTFMHQDFYAPRLLGARGKKIFFSKNNVFVKKNFFFKKKFFFAKVFFQEKNFFSKKQVFSKKNLIFPKKSFFSKNLFFYKKTFFFPKKIFFPNDSLFSNKSFFEKKNFFLQKSFTLIKMLIFSKLFI